VRPSGEAFHVAVGEDDDESDGGELKREAVKESGAKKEDDRGDEGEGEDEGGGEVAGGDGAVGGARVSSVEAGVGPAVEGHGGGTGSDHAEDDEAEGAERRPAVGGEDSARKSEREREDRVLPLNHLERNARTAEDVFHDYKPIAPPPFSRKVR
jgi:hypothetical protein